MNLFTNSQLVENIGWTLLHSLWQIALVAFVLFVLLKSLRNVSANVRYFAAVFALVFAIAFPVATFYQLNNSLVSVSQANQISTTNEIEFAEAPVFTPENVIATSVNKTETGTANSFSSFKNLQTFISKNLLTSLPFFVALWLFGMLIFGFRLIGGVWQLHIFKTRKLSQPSVEWQEKFFALCEQLNIRQNVEFFKSGLIETPVVIGWLKPVILVPASIFLQITPKELETIIAHELIHIKRYDALVNFAQSFVEVLFFYHPCVWWISNVIRKEREFAADEMVVKILENSRIVYATALANLEEIRLMTNQKSTPLLTAANGGNLMERITKILQKNTEINRVGSLWSAVAALGLVSAVLLTVFSFGTTAIVNVSAKTKDKKLAVGFISIPSNLASEADKSFDETPRLLIETLNKYKVPAIGFMQVLKINDDQNEQAEIMKMWNDADLEIGIGTYKRNGFYDKQFDEYAGGIEDTVKLAKQISGEKNIRLRYFNYPLRDTSITDDDIQRCEARLKLYNLSVVKYSIDNQEWMYSFPYEMARRANDSGKMLEIKSEFLKYMTEIFDHYEAYSQQTFGRNINQTMGLSTNRLVADSADELFEMLEKRGYEFVSMEEAQSDIAYQTQEDFAGVKAGMSWFGHRAKNKLRLDELSEGEKIQLEWRMRKASETSRKILEIMKSLPMPTGTPPTNATPPPAPPPPPPPAPPPPPKKVF